MALNTFEKYAVSCFVLGMAGAAVHISAGHSQIKRENAEPVAIETPLQIDQAKDQNTIRRNINAEFSAFGECLAWQARTRGFVRHGAKNRILAVYNAYAETCYNKLKPTAFGTPSTPNFSRVAFTTTGAEWFACRLDNNSAPWEGPMTCTDPSTQAYVKRMELRQ